MCLLLFVIYWMTQDILVIHHKLTAAVSSRNFELAMSQLFKGIN